MSRRIHADTDYETTYCDAGLHVRDVLSGVCLECGQDEGNFSMAHAELAGAEPPPGSVVMSQGPTGTAWQRFVSDGRWHSVTGKSTVWERLILSDRPGSRTRLVYLPPLRR